MRVVKQNRVSHNILDGLDEISIQILSQDNCSDYFFAIGCGKHRTTGDNCRAIFQHQEPI